MIQITAPISVTVRWMIVSATPHRMMFLAGTMQLVLAMLLWFTELLGRTGVGLSGPLPFVIASTSAHVLLMVYGLFTFYIYGFLFTVFPRWMGGAEIPRRQYVAVWALSVVGMVFAYIGLLTSIWLLAAGIALFACAWLAVIPILFGVYRRAPKRRTHELLLMLQLTVGLGGLLTFLYGALSENTYAFLVAREVGLWGFLVPVLLTICHRMIPFFTQSALPFSSVPRPEWSLAWFVGGCYLHAIFVLAAWPLPQLLIDVALATIALHHSVVWGLKRSFSVRLLAMLHVAFLWFGIAMALYAVQGAFSLADIAVLGRAPLHALGIGFVASTLIAMATRVTLGHSGQGLGVKAPTWYLFLALSVGVTLSRIAAEFVPDGYQLLNLLAAGGWVALLLPWAARYAPIYWRPRIDGRPG